MSWQFGIPDMLGPYTYFKTLNDPTPTFEAQVKRNLYDQAENQMNQGLADLNNVEKVKSATDFIANVAQSERGKELAAIQSYCNDMKITFPALEPYLENPDTIYNDPTHFYTVLTDALNTIRKGTDQYLRDLYRIKNNLEQNGRTIADYQAEDYRYRLDSDISTFLHRLIGNYQITDNLSEYNLKVQNMAMNILEKTNITKQLTNGEDFAAIAVSVLTDLESQIQKEFDDSKDKFQRLEDITDDILEKIEKKYLKQINTNMTETPVQRALMNISGIDFNRITKNAKELLNIQTPELNDKFVQKRLNQMKYRDKKNNNTLLQSIRERVTQNKKLQKNLNLINFSIVGSSHTRHGTMNELIQSMIGSNVKENVATDIITYRIRWDFQQNNEAFDTLINTIGNEFSSVLTDNELNKPANLRDLRSVVTSMNKRVDELIEAAEKQLANTKEGAGRDLFVFHETLKLYSSVETGNSTHEGFGGRSMNILSYIDYLTSASTIGIKNNIDRDTLAFFARNMIKGAIADNERGPLEKYFSIFAGMIMFDDVVNMAKEMVAGINNSNNVIGGKIRQVHLYNLNGLYVPASMILSYVSDAINEASSTVMEDFIQAHITTTSIERMSSKSQASIKNFNAGLIDGTPGLTEEDWNAAAAAATSSTKVSIIFLAAFEQFINNLFQFSKK